MPHRLPSNRWLIYLASFIFPFFGLAYGILQSAKPERVHKRMGKWCITLGLVSLVVICAGAIVWMAINIYGGFGSFI